MPTPTSYEDTILTAALAVLQNVDWAVQGSITMPAGNVKRRMLPQVDETLGDGQLPCVILSAGGPESETVADMEGHKNVRYKSQITIVAAGNRDYETYEPLMLAWRSQAKSAFGSPLISGAPSVWDVRISPGSIFDPSLLNQQYIYQSQVVEITSYESR